MLWTPAPLVRVRAQPSPCRRGAPRSAHGPRAISEASRTRRGATSRRSWSRGGSRPAAGQRPDRRRTLTHRAPHVADQHRRWRCSRPLAAHDLGFIDIDELVTARSDATLTTVEGLERFEGHLLNWYDTRTLAPLLPAYVSTVDSGNLAGALVTLAVGLREVAAGDRLRRRQPPIARSSTRSPPAPPRSSTA